MPQAFLGRLVIGLDLRRILGPASWLMELGPGLWYLHYGDLIEEVKKEGLKLCSQLKLQHQVKRDLKASKKYLGFFVLNMVLKCQFRPHKNIKNKNIIRKSLIKNTKNLRIINHLIKNKKTHTKYKREVRCFKCGQKGQIAPNCRKQKLNVLSDKKEEYYSKNNTSSSKTDKSQTKSITSEKKIDKIENCLCQINMLTADQELFIEMIDQIEDKEAKTKYIRKVL